MWSGYSGHARDPLEGRRVGEAVNLGYPPDRGQPLQEEALPRFGCAGTARVLDYPVDERLRFERLELPRLTIPVGEAWERNMILMTWIKEVTLAVTTVSLKFSDFVSKTIDRVKERYDYARRNPRQVLPKMEIPIELREYNSKLCVLLLPAIPEKVKQRVLEDVDDSPQLVAVNILDEVWSFVAPGGQEEVEGLTQYIRRLGMPTLPRR